jgi:hypothetical protein
MSHPKTTTRISAPAWASGPGRVPGPAAVPPERPGPRLLVRKLADVLGDLAIWLVLLTVLFPGLVRVWPDVLLLLPVVLLHVVFRVLVDD